MGACVSSNPALLDTLLSSYKNEVPQMVSKFHKQAAENAGLTPRKFAVQLERHDLYVQTFSYTAESGAKYVS